MLPYASSRSSSRLVRVLGVLIVLSVVVGAVWWYLRPPRKKVVALFQVTALQPSVSSSERATKFDSLKWELFKRTQMALLKSEYVITSALRAPGIASLGVLADKDDPVQWLEHALQVRFPKDGEVMEIKLVGTEDEKEDLVNLVNATVKAYEDEVLALDRQQRTNDLDRSQRALSDLQQAISTQLKELNQLVDESENVAGDKGRLLQQLDAEDRARIEQEILRLQAQATDPAVAGKEEYAGAIQEQIARLNKRSSELRKQMIGRSATSPEITTRREELVRLNRFADELTLALERSELDRSEAPRIKKLQAAVASDEKTTADDP